MKRSRPFRKTALPVLFWIAAAGVASAQFDFRGMIDGAMDQVQGAVNGAIDRIRGSDEDGSGGDGYAPEDGAPTPIAGQDNAFSLDFGGDAAPSAAGSAAPAQGGENISVLARGMGTNREEALKDAYRDAIERAVGMYVDAEQMMQNEQLVHDQILTHSNAYIERYDIKKEETRPNGLTEIQILAVVNRSALTKKLSEVMPAQTFQVGGALQDLHAQSVTTQKRGEDAVALLQNVLKDANPITQLMKVSLSPVKPQMRKASFGGSQEKELMYMRFNVTVDEQKYFGEFLPPLLTVFDQIALERPKNILLQARLKDDSDNDEKSEYLQGKYEEYIPQGDPGNNTSGPEYQDRDGAPVGEVLLGNADYDMTYLPRDGWSTYYLEKQGCVHAVVIVKMNADRSVIQARHYRLPLECGKVFEEWKASVYFRSGSYKKTTTYNVMFTDNAGEPVAAFPITFENSVLGNFELGSYKFGTRHQTSNVEGLYLTPMVSMNAKARERWIGFDIPRSLLPSIKSVKIELAE